MSKIWPSPPAQRGGAELAGSRGEILSRVLSETLHNQQKGRLRSAWPSLQLLGKVEGTSFGGSDTPP
jgi:hypothetical protein